MELKQYIQTVLTNLPGKRKVKFDIGIQVWGKGADFRVMVTPDSTNRIKFEVQRSSKHIAEVEKEIKKTLP